jgi:hypothetical protein
VFCTPPIDQPARKCTAVDEGHAVEPDDANVAAPFLIDQCHKEVLPHKFLRRFPEVAMT